MESAPIIGGSTAPPSVLSLPRAASEILRESRTQTQRGLVLAPHGTHELVKRLKGSVENYSSFKLIVHCSGESYHSVRVCLGSHVRLILSKQKLSSPQEL